MFCILMFGLFFKLVAHTQASQAVATLDPNPDYPDKCVYESEEEGLIILGEGESVTPTEGRHVCTRLGCSGRDGDKFVLVLTGCGAADYDSPGCRADMDLTKPYPDCCPKLVCDEEGDEVISEDAAESSDYGDSSEDELVEIAPVTMFKTTPTNGDKKPHRHHHHHSYHNKYYYLQQYRKWLAIQAYWRRIMANRVSTRFGHWRGKKHQHYHHHHSPKHYYGTYYFYHHY